QGAGGARAEDRAAPRGAADQCKSVASAPPRSELAHEPDHHAEDLEAVVGTNGRVRLVLGAQDELAALAVEALQRELVVDDRDDDVATLRGGALLDDDEIAVEDTRVDHRVALDADQHRLRRVL